MKNLIPIRTSILRLTFGFVFTLLTHVYSLAQEGNDRIREIYNFLQQEDNGYYSELDDSTIMADVAWIKNQPIDKENVDEVSTILNTYGSILRHRDLYAGALECLSLNNELCIRYGDNYREYINIGHLFANIGDLESAQAYYQKGYNFAKDTLPEGSDNKLNALSWGIIHIGRLRLHDSADFGVAQISKAIDLWKLAGEDNRERGAITFGYRLLVHHFLSTGQLIEGSKMLDSMRSWYIKEQGTNGELYLTQSKFLLEAGNIDSALYLINYMIDSTKYTNAIGAYSIKERILAQKGNYKDAYALRVQIDSIKDIQKSNYGSVAFYREQNKLDELKYEQELERRSDREVRFYWIFGAATLLLLSLGLFGRMRYINKSRKLISAEKDRSENLLLNILPAEIAEELKEKGSADARDFDQATILFTDFKEFTRISRSMNAQDLVEEINACFEAFDQICEKYHIEKIKTIGDSYMAAGGLPIPSPNSVKNVVLAALEMCEFIQRRKSLNEAQGMVGFEMRVGIHTGPVVAGIVGIKKFQYDIWGDTVNTASRMESNGEVGMVNVSKHTYELLKDDSDLMFTERGKLHAKGLGDIQMYFVSRK